MELKADIVRLSCAGTPLVTKRKSGYARARGYCAALAEVTQRIYGRTMRTCVANIANKVLGGATLTAQNIRDWGM